jgi:3',5'-cyclic AMP phosphodiesterase CpdA
VSRFRIAHLSDSHFGTVLPGVAEGLISTVNELKPDLVLLSGDITQRARRSQFREAAKFSAQLKQFPFIAVPGNHDIPLYNVFGRLFNPYGNFIRFFKPGVEKDFDHGDIVIIGLNSTSKWRHVQGAFDLERLERRLQKVEPRHKVRVAVFHHPIDCRLEKDEKNLVKCRHEVMRILSKHKIDLIVGGHIHDPHMGTSHKRYPELGRACVIGVAGTCTSWRVRGTVPNSFNLIDFHTEATPRLTLSRFDQRPGLRFTLEEMKKFALTPDTGWIESN